jgi:hypothetical protein
MASWREIRAPIPEPRYETFREHDPQQPTATSANKLSQPDHRPFMCPSPYVAPVHTQRAEGVCGAGEQDYEAQQDSPATHALMLGGLGAP